jgi:Protein of unknown function (DUF3485)
MSQTQLSPAPAAAAPRNDSNKVGAARYVWIAVAIVAVIQGGGFALERAFFVSRVRPLHHSLAELPLALGPWAAKDQNLDSKTFPSVGAEEQSERLYKTAAGDAIFVHRAAWIVQDDWTPHIPELCYTSNGWELSQSRLAPLADGSGVLIAIQHYQQGTQRAAVAYWYQLDKAAYVDRDGGRKLRRGLWGRRDWPPLVKTLLQTDDTEGAEKRLIELATRVYESNCEL